MPDTNPPAVCTRLRRLALAGIAALLLSIVLPRFVTGDGGGFDGVAEAALIFLGLAGLAVVLALWALALGVRHRRELTTGCRLLGGVPLLAIAAVAGWVAWRVAAG